MADPKPGSKRYKGPVHEAVRSGLSKLGIDTDPPKSKAKPVDNTKLHAWLEDFRKTGYTPAPVEYQRGDIIPQAGKAHAETTRPVGGVKVGPAVKGRTKARKTGATKTARRMTRRIDRKRVR